MQTNTKLQLLQYRLLNFTSILRVFKSVIYKERQIISMTHFTIYKCILFIFTGLAQEYGSQHIGGWGVEGEGGEKGEKEGGEGEI